MNSYVVRKASHDSEVFDPVRLHGSILQACMMVQAFEGEAHDIAENVCKHVINWLEGRTEVSSDDIHRVTTQHLTKYHPEAAYMYEQQALII